MCEPYISHTAVQTIEIKDELKNEQVLKNIIKNLIIQRIRYIHMPLNEIENEYQSEIIENPFVEVVDIKAKGSKSNIEKHSRSDYLSEYKRDIETRGIDWEGYFNDIEKTSHRGDYSTDYCDAPPLENIAVAEETLYDHLVSQLYQVSLSEKQINIGKVIIGFIDRKGFLTASSAEIAAHADLRKEKATVKEVNAVITAIQEFDPSGVCARNAAESIQLQYRALCRERSEQIKFPEKIEKIINNYFNELARKKYEDIAKNLSIDIDQVKKCVLFIVKNFTPWPGLQYASDPVNASVKPEVFIEKTNGGYSVTVEEFKIPEIRLNPEYMKMLKRDDVDQSVKDLINRKLNRALFIKKSIEQRRETIKKVVECIALMQKEYLDHGVWGLRPLKMSEVALETGFNESTVSRVASGKYVRTPHGTHEIKFFFSGGLRTANGGRISFKSVKLSIERIISEEPADEPYTDQGIVDILTREGVVISRRTVAKYRDELNILSAAKRKRQRS